MIQVHITRRNVFAMRWPDPSYCLILEIMWLLTSGLTMSGCVCTNSLKHD